jgi:hypothetical protein
MYPYGDSSTLVISSKLVGLDKGAGEANGSSFPYSGESGVRAKLESLDEEPGD